MAVAVADPGDEEEFDEYAEEEGTAGYVPPLSRFRDPKERLQSIEEDKRARLQELAARLVNVPYSPWTPTERQRRFLLDFSKEVLYGGAVGGAKSVALLMAALQFVEIPGYSAILFRRSFADLNQPGALMVLAKDWLSGRPGTRYDPNTHTWYFPSGASITFGYMERVNDHLKYQGAAYQFVGFDEVTQHQANQYTYMFSRLRKPATGPLGVVPLRMRATANPGGPGHEWVYRRFIKPWELWQAGKASKPLRTFIVSKLGDNPHLDREAYLETLAELDPVTRAQLLRGDWSIRPDGRMFKRDWFKHLNHAEVDPGWHRIRYWDLAATDEEPGKDPDWTAGCLLAISPKGQIVVMDIKRTRRNPAEVEKLIAKTARGDGHGIPIYMEQEPGSAGKTVIHYYRTQVLGGYQFHGNLPSGKKTVRAAPMASQGDAGNVYMLSGRWNDSFLDEVEMFPDGFHDDQVDAMAGAYQVLVKRPHPLVFGQQGKSTGDESGLRRSGKSPWRM